MPQLALLNIPVCTKNVITLVSSTGTEDAFELWSKFVDLHIYSLLCYTCNQYNYYWILNRTLLQMSFQYNKEPLWKNTILSNYMPTSWEISWYFNIFFWLHLRLEILSSEMQTPAGRWHLTPMFAHSSCLKTLQVKPQIKSWGLTQGSSSGYPPVCHTGQGWALRSVWVRNRGINPFLKLSFRLSIHEETADRSDKRKPRSKVHFTGIFRLSGKMSNTFACFSAILKVIIKWKITVS